LKHKFIKGAKKTSQLVDLIDRRQRWIQAVGHQESDDDSDKDDKEKGNEEDDSWIFDTIKDKKPHQLTNEEIEKLEKGPPSRVNALKNTDPERSRSMSDTSGQKTPQKPPSVGKSSPSTPAPQPQPQPTTPAPVEHKPTAPANDSAQTTPAQTAASQPDKAAKPSALTSVIYPVLSKLLKQNQEEGVIASLAQLKIAFDNAERAKPGITHQLIAQIIETLKR